MSSAVMFLVCGNLLILAAVGTHSAHLTFPSTHPFKDRKSTGHENKWMDATSDLHFHHANSSRNTWIHEVSSETTVNTSDTMMPTPQKLIQNYKSIQNSKPQETVSRNNVWIWNKQQRLNPQLNAQENLAPFQNHKQHFNVPRKDLYAVPNTYSYTPSRRYYSPYTPPERWEFRMGNQMTALPSRLSSPSSTNSPYPPQRNTMSLPFQLSTQSSNIKPRIYPKGHSDMSLRHIKRRFRNNIIQPNSQSFIHDLTSYYYKNFKFNPNFSVIRTIPAALVYGNQDLTTENTQLVATYIKDKGYSSNERTYSNSKYSDLRMRKKDSHYEEPDEEQFTSEPDYYPPTVSFGEPYFEEETSPPIFHTDPRASLSRNTRTHPYQKPHFNRGMTHSKYTDRVYTYHI